MDIVAAEHHKSMCRAVKSLAIYHELVQWTYYAKYDWLKYFSMLHANWIFFGHYMQSTLYTLIYIVHNINLHPH